MSRTSRTTRPLLARGAALTAVTVLALTACGGSDDSADTAPAEDRSTEQAAEPSDGGGAPEASDGGGTEEGDETAAGAGAVPEGTVVEIGTEFTDEETGDVITIVSAVRNNPTEYYESIDNPDGEMIYLEVSVTPGDQFGGVISQSSFLVDSDGEEVNYAGTAEEELTAAGYEYFDGASRRDGEATGYIPVYVPTTAETLDGVYVREETKILGEDTTIPEFRGEFEIPAS